MLRYFVRTNADAMVVFVDANNRAYAFNETEFEHRLTPETAAKADYSNCAGCKTADEVAHSVGCGETFEWDEADYDEIIPF